MTWRLEPAMILAAAAATVNAIQAAAIPGLPAWAHSLIAVASILTAGYLTRQHVTPTAADDPGTGI